MNEVIFWILAPVLSVITLTAGVLMVREVFHTGNAQEQGSGAPKRA